ncbi:MAG: hypothetical protein ChlgKO_01140 [Chlamydiales bacterium]
MKKNTHPEYQEILFVDTATGTKFVCGSTLQTKERETFEGKEYPVYRAPITSASHPFFTGETKFVDTEGRLEKFKKRYARAPQPVEEKKEEEAPKKKLKKPAVKAAAEKKPAAKKPTAKKVAAKKAAPKKTTEE